MTILCGEVVEKEVSVIAAGRSSNRQNHAGTQSNGCFLRRRGTGSLTAGPVLGVVPEKCPHPPESSQKEARRERSPRAYPSLHSLRLIRFGTARIHARHSLGPPDTRHQRRRVA